MNKNGNIESISPIRDYEYSAISGGSNQDIVYPKKFQVEFLGAEVKNQGSICSCVGCAMATVMEAWIQKLFSKNITFSEGWNYGKLRDDNAYYTGMIHSQALKYQTEIGSCPKSLYDVLLEMPEAYNEVTKFPELLKDAANYKFSGFVKMNQGDTRTGQKKDLEIKEALTKYNIPLFVISPKAFGESHALCIVGWNDENDTYIYKNSWGDPKNNGGLGEKPKDVFREVYLLTYESIKLPFTDVKEGDWFYDAVKTCYMSGVINGKTLTEFCPNDTITRAEAATMMSRVMKKIDDRFDTLNKLIEIKHKYNKLEEYEE